jgi:hypothetical protein
MHEKSGGQEMKREAYNLMCDETKRETHTYM